MSRNCLKSAVVMALVLNVAAASAQAAGRQTGDEAFRAPISTLAPPIYHLAMMDEMSGMGGMGDNGGENMGGRNMGGNMPPGTSMPGGSSNMQNDAADAPADMMGRMRGSMRGRSGMGSTAPNSRLPGFPGASHLYHVGASGFFLDHPQHISLSTVQQTSLNRIKEKALLDRANLDRRIEDAEQELWTLTAADTPDAAKIDATVRAIEKLRGDQRLAFIRAVGDAAQVLTAEQQAALLGTKPPAGTGQQQPAAPKPPTMPRM